MGIKRACMGGVGEIVGEVQLMKLLPSTIDMCVWLNNRNSTMFLVTCK